MRRDSGQLASAVPSAPTATGRPTHVLVPVIAAAMIPPTAMPIEWPVLPSTCAVNKVAISAPRRCGRSVAMLMRLRTHWMSGRARTAKRSGQVRELAEERARLARVHDLLDPERLGRAERRAQLRQPVLDLRHLHPGIGCRVDLRAIRGLDPALERQRAPAAGRPGVARAVAAAITVRGAGDAEAVAHDDRAPRDRRLPDGRH